MIKPNKILILILVGVLALPFSVLAINQDIVITEIGAYEPSDHEWIEIYNKGASSVDLTGWKFFEDNTNHGLTAYRGDLVIDAGEYAIIADVASKFAVDYSRFSGTIIDSSWTILKESGEPIALKDGGGNIVESFTYIVAGSGSLERVDFTLPDYSSNNWREYLGGNSAGLPNSIPSSQNPASTNNATTGSTNSSEAEPSDASSSENASRPQAVNPRAYGVGSIIINEFVSEPGDDQTEWIEIMSKAGQVVVLDGWTLEDGLGKIAELGGEIFPQSFKVIELQNSRLNNSGDTIKLFDAAGTIIDEVTYGNFDDGNMGDNAVRPKAGNALARAASGLDTNKDNFDWFRVLTITPGAPNAASVQFEEDQEDIEEEAESSRNSSSGIGVATPVRPLYTEVVTFSNDYGDDNGKATSGVLKARQEKDSTHGKIVRGVVTALPGILGSQIFYLQTNDGGREIYMFKKDFPSLALGDYVRASGRQSQVQGRSRLKISARSDIEILRHGPPPEPTELAISEISNDHDSSLIRARGEIIDISSRNQFIISDGEEEVLIYLKPTAGIRISDLREGNEITVTGILNFKTSGARLLPRGPEDIEWPQKEVIPATSVNDSPVTLNKNQTAVILFSTLIISGFAITALGVKFKNKIFTFRRKLQAVEEVIDLD